MAARQVLPDAVLGLHPDHPPLPALRLVVTRFNMVLNAEFRQAPALAGEAGFAAWLDHRLALFQAVTLRSLAAQTQRPDAWLIGFDAARRAAVQPVLRRLARHDWIIPVWQEQRDGRHESPRLAFQRGVAGLLRPGQDWVVTTRLDNDDALNRHHQEALADYAAAVVARRPGIEDFWVSFPLGAQYGAGTLRLFPYTNSPFLSRVERVGAAPGWRAGTALQGHHGHVFDQPQVFTATTRWPMWLQVVHGANVLNRVREKLPILAEPGRELARFGLTPAELAPWCPAPSEGQPPAGGD